MAITVVTAGAGYPVTSVVLESTSPALVATTRALGAALVMLLFLRLARARLPSTRRAWTWAVLIGFGNVTITLAAIAEGTSLAGSAIASVLLNSAPFFATLFGRLFLGERVTALRLAGLVVGFSGIVVVVISANDTGAGSNPAAGVAVCLAGALGWAAAGVAMRHVSVQDAGFDVYGAITAQFLAGGVLLLPYLALSDGLYVTGWSARFVAGMAFLVLGAQIVTYLGFYVALKRWTSSRVFAWTFLAPVTAVLITAAQGELPGLLTTAGLLIVISGVALVNHPRAEAGAITAPGRARRRTRPGT